MAVYTYLNKKDIQEITRAFNLGKLIKRGIVKINNEKIYCLTAHGDDLWLKYNKDWFNQ